MKLIDDYEKAKQAIYDHVGFTEDWVVFPLDDATYMFWLTFSDNVWYAKTEAELKKGMYQELVELPGEGEAAAEIYSDWIYTQRHYPKHVYEGDELTMIFCDPQTDNCKWFRLFDNAKRVKISISDLEAFKDGS